MRRQILLAMYFFLKSYPTSQEIQIQCIATENDITYITSSQPLVTPVSLVLWTHPKHLKGKDFNTVEMHWTHKASDSYTRNLLFGHPGKVTDSWQSAQNKHSDRAA